MPTPVPTVLHNAVISGNANISVTVPADCVMLVALIGGASGGAPASVAWNGSEALTGQVSVSDTNTAGSAIWDLPSPTVGAHNLTYTATGNRLVVIVALSGVDLVTPRTTGVSFGGFQSSGVAKSVTPTTIVGDLVFSLAADSTNGVTLTDGSSQTMIATNTIFNGTTAVANAGYKTATGTSTAMTYTPSAGVFMALVALGYHGAAATAPLFLPESLGFSALGGPH